MKIPMMLPVTRDGTGHGGAGMRTARGRACPRGSRAYATSTPQSRGDRDQRSPCNCRGRLVAGVRAPVYPRVAAGHRDLRIVPTKFRPEQASRVGTT